MLGLDGKDRSSSTGVEPFIKHCKESVLEIQRYVEDFPTPLVFGLIWSIPTLPTRTTSSSPEWWAPETDLGKRSPMKVIRSFPYRPRWWYTPLSSHEVAQGYKDVKERSAIAKFKVVGEDAISWA